MNYVQQVTQSLTEQIPGQDNSLYQLYTLLALVKGEDVTLEDVHDAWSVWRNETNPNHKSLVPFNELIPEIQELDRPYAEAIVKAAKFKEH